MVKLIVNTIAAVNKLNKKQSDLAVQRAINKLLPKLVTTAWRSIKDRYNVKRKDLDFSTIKAGKNLVGFIKAKRRGISRVLTPWKDKGGGIESLFKKGAPEFMKGAFFATMPKTGAVGLFWRIGKERLPIKQWYGKSGGRILQDVETKTAMQKGIDDYYPALLNHEKKRLADKK